MWKVDGPATPAGEIATRRQWRGPTLADGILTPDLAEFCQGGVSVILASCHEGRPIAGRGFACRIDAQGTIRILLRRTGHVALLAALRGGAGIAATFSRPLDHRSIQFKGKRAREAPASAVDGMALAVQSREFRDQMVAIKYSEHMSNGYCFAGPEDIVAIEFVPDEAFVQTPGPSAGSELKG